MADSASINVRSRARLNRPNDLLDSSPQLPSATISDYYRVSSIVMSAAAVANTSQYQDAFDKKKQQQQQQHEQEGGLSSHPAAPKSDINVSKVQLEDPFTHDDSQYLSNATYSRRLLGYDVVDEQSIHSTPVGKIQVASVDTPLPASAAEKQSGTSANDIDDYDKIVKVIDDRMAQKLPAVPQSESIQGQAQKRCCCGHKAPEEPASANEAKSSTGEKSAEQKTVADQSDEKSEGEEETDEGDDTVIVTIEASEPAPESMDEPAKVAGNAKHMDKIDDKAETKKTE